MIEDSHDGIITAIKELSRSFDIDLKDLRSSFESKFDNLASKIDAVQSTAGEATMQAFTALQKIQTLEEARAQSGTRLGSLEAEFNTFQARYDEREKLRKEQENSANGKNNWIIPLIVGVSTIITMVVMELIIKGGKS